MNQFAVRKYIVGGLIILTGLIFLVRLFFLQVVDSTYKTTAESNAMRIEIHTHRLAQLSLPLAHGPDGPEESAPLVKNLDVAVHAVQYKDLSLFPDSHFGRLVEVGLHIHEVFRPENLRVLRSPGVWKQHRADPQAYGQLPARISRHGFLTAMQTLTTAGSNSPGIIHCP